MTVADPTTAAGIARASASQPGWLASNWGLLAAIAVLAANHAATGVGRTPRGRPSHARDFGFRRRRMAGAIGSRACGDQCDIRQQIGLVASSSQVIPPNIHSPRRLWP
jgi:hypothetical protein